MSNMSSFYGGRPGAPFVIVKTFDAIKLESNKIHTKSYYALDEEGNYLISDKGNVQLDENHFLVKKNAENYYEYNWKLATNDGKTQINQTNFKFPEEQAEGMVNFFSKGISTLDEVNYQEYVLIDTVTNLNEYLNPDNGKLFRRGLDINNDLCGAEYVGRIVGAQGFNTGIQLDTFETVSKANSIIKGTVESDLVGGNVSSKIECAYFNILDEGGNVLQTKIGFKFPYLVNTFKANQISPYDVVENEDLISEVDKDGNILSGEHSNNNPFYRHWSIKVPHGKKGDSIALVRKQPILAPEGIKYYTSLANLQSNTSAGTLASSITISGDKYLVSEDDFAYIQLETNKFVKVEDCTNNKVFYIIRNYDSSKTGSLSIPIEVGDIDSIIKTDLAEDGTLTIYYDNGKTEIARNKIRWITSTELNNNTSKLEIKYNEDSKDIISPAINYIKETYISSINDQKVNSNIIPNSLYVLYSDPEYKKTQQVQINGKTGGWIRLGSVTPPASNLKLIKRFTSELELDDNIPPESLEDDNGNPLGYDAYATGVLIGNYIYLYDYLGKRWYNSETTLGQATNASSIVNVSNQKAAPSDMIDNSIWFGIVDIDERG